MQIKFFNELIIKKQIFKKNKNNRIINIYKLEHFSVTGHNLFYPNILLQTETDLILPLLEKTMSLNMGTIYEKNKMIFNPLKQKIKYTCKEPLFFFNLQYR